MKDIKTLKEAKDYLKENYEDGCKCPACDQNVKLYKRKLNSSMAYGLIFLLNLHKKHPEAKGFHMNREIANLKIPSSNIEYAKLAYWGMIEELPIYDNSKARSSGMWRITPKGKGFAMNETTTPMRAHIFNNRVWGYSEEHTTIFIALDNKFSYYELMNT